MKSSLKIYLLIISIAFGGTVLIINFTVLPRLIETMSEFSPAFAKTLKDRFNYIIIGYLGFLLLGNFYFWRADNLLEKEKERVRGILRINPNDSLAQEKLRKIEKKKKFYIMVIEPLFLIVSGLMVGFLAYTVITSLYRFLGEI